MKKVFTIALVLITSFLLLCLQEDALAQYQSRYYNVGFSKDSQCADNQNKIIYNTVKITNPNNKAVRLGISVTIPTGWKNLLDKDNMFGEGVFYNLNPKEVKSIPLNLMKLPAASASWDSVKVKVWMVNLADTHTYYIHVRTQPIRKYNFRTPTEDIMLDERPEYIELPVYLKNTGNITDNYELVYQEYSLQIDEKINIQLAPGQDTNYIYKVPVKSAQWTSLYQQKVLLIINTQSRNSSYLYKLSKSKSFIKEKNSAYKTMPISLEGGFISIGKNHSYYGAIQGNLNLGDKKDLSFYYRSKQYGNLYYNLYQPNVFLVTYRHDHWRLAVGQVAPTVNYFIFNGYGAKLGYTWSDGAEVNVGVFKHNEHVINSNNDGIGIDASYKVKKVAVLQNVIANHDIVKDVNSVIISNNVKLVEKKGVLVSVKAGAGSEDKTPAGIQKTTLGLFGGASLLYTYKNWKVAGVAEMYGNNVPGINKGRRLQAYDLTRKLGKYHAGVFYNSSYIKTNYFRDSLFNTDYFAYNMTSYGVNGGFKTAKQYLNVSTGIISNKVNGQRNALNDRYLVSLDYLQTFNTFSQLSLNSTNAILDGGIASTDAFTFNNRYSGFFLAYSRTPNTIAESGAGVDYVETVTGGPNVNFQITKKLFTSVRYTFFKTLQDNNVRQGFGGTINYSNYKKGITFQANGFYTLDNGYVSGMPIQNTRSFQVSMIKTFNVPLPFRRKYHDLTAVLYNDVNNNGKHEEDESTIHGAKLFINDNPLKTNKQGEVKCRNISDGDYLVSMQNTQADGLIPVDGTEKNIVVEGSNKTIEIPFKKGKIIRGLVTIQRDTFSNMVMTADFIKVIAVDTTGKRYTTLTDANGNFKMYVPAGIYTVSLNPMAFEGSNFRPVKLSYDLDLMGKDEDKVLFEVKQKTRKVRYMEAKANDESPDRNTKQ